MIEQVAIVYNTRLARAQPLAQELAAVVRSVGLDVAVGPTTIDDRDGLCRDADLIVTIGGDGTILRTARVAAGTSAAIVGVNLGALGFMAELQPDTAAADLPFFLDGNGWREERTLLTVKTVEDGATPDDCTTGELALNEVLVGRGVEAHIVKVRVSIDGAPVTTFVADGVLVATATGSTAYALAAGGPILAPGLDNMVVTSLLPYLSFNHPLVLAPSSSVELRLFPDYEAWLTIDGQIGRPLRRGQAVHVTVGPHRCAFLRRQPPNYFWATVTRRLRYRDQGD